MTPEHTQEAADLVHVEPHACASARPPMWVWQIAALSGGIVVGALYLIATRADGLAVDLGPHLSSWLWCF